MLLQEDLQKKIEIIQKQQKENRTMQFESTLSPTNKRDEFRIKKEYDQLVLHILEL